MKLKIVLCLALLGWFYTPTYAQLLDDVSINPQLRSYTLFDPGSHKISDKSDAFCRGVGLGIDKQLNKNLSLNFNYGLAYIDSLAYGEFYTSTASFHQLDANIAFTPFSNKRVNPSVSFGYGLNLIPQLKELQSKSFGTNVNLGANLEVQLNSYLSLKYSTYYGIGLAEQIRYHFRNQIGIGFRLNNYQSTRTKNKLAELEERIAYDLNVISDYDHKVDSLTRIANQVAEKTIENYKLKETLNRLSFDASEVQKSNAKLNKEIAELKLQLNQTIFFSDSVEYLENAAVYKVDTFGKILGRADLNGYYYSIQFLQFSDASAMTSTFEQLSGTKIDVVYYNGYFVVLGYLAQEKEEVIEAWRLISDNTPNLKLYKF